MSMLEMMASILKGIESASAGFQTVNKASIAAGDASYGDVIEAIAKSTTNGYWKNRMIEDIPKDAMPSEYAAALQICNSTDEDYWKHRALQKIFKRP